MLEHLPIVNTESKYLFINKPIFFFVCEGDIIDRYQAYRIFDIFLIPYISKEYFRVLHVRIILFSNSLLLTIFPQNVCKFWYIPWPYGLSLTLNVPLSCTLRLVWSLIWPSGSELRHLIWPQGPEPPSPDPSGCTTSFDLSASWLPGSNWGIFSLVLLIEVTGTGAGEAREVGTDAGEGREGGVLIKEERGDDKGGKWGIEMMRGRGMLGKKMRRSKWED